ncbi:MAG: porin [Phycisphaeraceae bacterium]|nr:porin [Phycisphaeraceae bacterium]
MRGKQLLALGGSLVMGIAGVASADTAPSDTQMNAELETLKARIAELEGQQNQTWMTERRAEEVKTLIREVLSDAETRASLLQEGVTAGHNGEHFFLGGGDFLMEVSGQAQVRYTYNFEDGVGTTGAASANADEDVAGFDIRRAKLQFAGHAHGVGYTFRIASESTEPDADTDLHLEVASLSYEVADGWTLSGGRMKAPFLREELTHSGHQLAVERSLVNEQFTAGYVEGISLAWDAHENAKLAMALTDGARSGEQGTDTSFDDDNSDFAFTSRLDIRLAGDWSQKDDFTAWSGEETAAFLGAAVHYQKFETGDSDTGATRTDDDFVAYTVDASVEHNNFGFYAAGIGLHTDDTSLDSYGAVFQANYLIDDKVEPFIRYEWIDPANNGPEANLLTFGGNYYIDGHNAKFTLDMIWALNELSAATAGPLGGGSGFAGTRPANAGTGLLADTAGDDGQLVVRGQFQLLF